MSKPVVLIAEELSPATLEALGPDFEVREVDGADRAKLLPALKEANAVLIRSATKMDEEAIAAAPKLKVIARAGVGLDNVDIKAATNAGVMVVNAPTSNVISAAELAIGQIMALSRHIPDANASLKQGLWKRSKYTGVELYEKTIGIIGLGRIGTLVAQRLQGFGVTLIGFDPYVTQARAEQIGVELVSMDQMMERADYITIHIPKTPETTGMIAAEQFAKAKPNLRIVNCSRGGIIDEAALYDALKSGQIAGAGLDVFVTEPPTGSPLLELENILVTPHLGASTDEAQEKAGISVARSVRLALAGDLVPDAVNVAGGVIDASVKPGIALAEKLGQIVAGLAHTSIVSVEFEARGEIAAHDVTVLKLAALKGIFQTMVTEQVSYVNAPLMAEQRGVEVRLVQDTASDEYRNVTTLKAVLSDGTTVSAGGTVIGPKHQQKIVSINGYDVELAMAENLVVMVYQDRPGIVAIYGKAFSEASVNIAAMTIARQQKGGKALSVITVDSPVAPEVLEKLRNEIQADLMQAVSVVEQY
ncbi:MAG: phosphoglycerate dehydrogenase [Aquiluna sp.]|nr:phosphoglycerate dehydrogenase [Aquiluna sp.]MCF8546140.1 phosphoglycerate dehydrogenase [Aquiluna sp.]